LSGYGTPSELLDNIVVILEIAETIAGYWNNKRGLLLIFVN
jgi:hypothetical protein